MSETGIKKSNLNIFQKLQEARIKIAKKDIKKTGKCSYKGSLKYTFFELSDIQTVVTKVCNEVGITPVLEEFTEDRATLKLYDNENPKDFIPFSMNVKICQLVGCNDMQNIGGSYSYAKRYLYMSAFEIADSDLTELLGDEEGADDFISNISVKTIENIIEKTNTDLMAFLTWARVDSIKNITNRNLPSIMQMLERKEKEYEKNNLSKKVEEEVNGNCEKDLKGDNK